MNLFSYAVKTSYVDLGAFFDSFYLFFGLDDPAGWNFMPFKFKPDNALIKLLVALFVLFAAATPAGFITTDLCVHFTFFPASQRE
jgi:hypothetical protein